MEFLVVSRYTFQDVRLRGDRKSSLVSTGFLIHFGSLLSFFFWGGGGNFSRVFLIQISTEFLLDLPSLKLA